MTMSIDSDNNFVALYFLMNYHCVFEAFIPMLKLIAKFIQYVDSKN